MLQITIPAIELWDERIQEFVTLKEQTLQLEHSLVSIAKWESKWCKPFYTKDPKTYEETLDYVKCMTLDENVDPIVYLCLSEKNVSDINAYIEHPMTATTFSANAKSKAGKNNGEKVTSELIYYWMIAFNIPVQFETWHLNRLLTLIQVCEIKNEPPKKMSKREVMSRNAALNAARRKQMNTSG